MAHNKGPSGVRVIFPDELQEFIARHREGTYQLIDVRQPEEYEEFHLPGSRLIPLPVLVDSLEELDRASDTIIYCAVGGRSLIVAQFLAVRGFDRVFQLQGGIEAWEDRTAAGSPELHLEFIRGDESAIEAAAIAYRFEAGLEQFHRAANAKSQIPEIRDLLEKLIRAEESHRRKLLRLLESLGSGPQAAGAPEGYMEGGLKIDDFLARNGSYLKSAKGCLELAMMIEVQALDLYLRMAQTCSDAAAKELFYRLGDEEKVHLNSLADLAARIGHG
ncbi:MAG: rhodanese-like domain-containing protein [Syntrophobacteraceae bacterium]|jgi:rhodanese-related sulfurtransferase